MRKYRYIKSWERFYEDGDGGGGTAYASGNIGGMGPVISAQPGALPGTTGTTGSGDIGVTFKKEKRKKGDPSEVSDLRDLKDASVNKVIESRTDDNIELLIDYLKTKNYSSIQIQKIVYRFSGDIKKMTEKGFNSNQILDKIKDKLPMDGNNDHFGILQPNATWRNLTYL